MSVLFSFSRNLDDNPPIALYIYMCVCVCVYLGSISSLMQISLNIIDILCLHIFFWIRSNSRITFIVFGEKIITDNTTILEHQNNEQKLQILEALHIRNLQPTLNRINFQTSANVLKCL